MKAMKWLFTIVLAYLIPLVPKAQNIILDENAEARTVAPFDKIDVRGGLVVYLTNGNEPSLAVSAANKADLPKIISEVVNGTLVLKVESGTWNGWNWTNKKLKVYVALPQLTSVDASGGSIVKTVDTLNAPSLNMYFHGGSIGTFWVRSTQLSIKASGGSIMEFLGKTTQYTADISGGSILKTSEFISGEAEVNVSGGSVAKVQSTNLKIKASGGSVVDYKKSTAASARVTVVRTGGSVVNGKSTDED
ncbi:MAG: DUF2807 domain-containing protein [Bacteroidetes bacterium]|nr:MAG: DUF2807 domain-containing protein [Bacteroidota bacterium]TAF90749.1 MAG: DUF2807 domain-containing protein [Bacteroidota bacterium]